MDFESKALQLLNARGEREINVAIRLFTDRQKDMMLKVLLKCCRGEQTTPDERLEKMNQV